MKLGEIADEVARIEERLGELSYHAHRYKQDEPIDTAREHLRGVVDSFRELQMNQDELKTRLAAIQRQIQDLLGEVEDDESEDTPEGVVDALNSADASIDEALSEMN